MKKYLTTLIIAVTFLGCDNFLAPPNEQDLSADSFWQNSEHVKQAITAAYAPLQSFDGSKWTFFEQVYIATTWKADDILNAPTDYGKSLANFTNGTDESSFTSFWKSNYTGIYYANQIIEKVPEIAVLSDEEKTAAIAEAKFLRALYHFHLLVGFENIALITSTPKTPDDFFASQVAPSVVWTQIESDLTDAIAGLPVPSDSDDQDNLGRANLHTATAYLGKVYLFQEKWAQAVTEFDKVRTNGSYSLLPNYADNFNGVGENGAESVFEIQWSGNRANGNDERHPFNFEVSPGALGGWELFYPSDWLFAEMKTDLTVGDAGFSDRVYGSIFFDDPLSEMSDRRAGEDNKFYSDVKADLTHDVYFKKYADDFDREGDYTGLNVHLMRYADVLLMLAEALNEDNQTATAYQYVNDVRTRSNAAPLAASFQGDQAALRQQIRHHERPVELSMEYTIRWFDLYRWAKGSTAKESISGTLNTHGKPFVGNYQDGVHDVFPIPFSEISKNPNLDQNPGY